MLKYNLNNLELCSGAVYDCSVLNCDRGDDVDLLFFRGIIILVIFLLVFMLRAHFIRQLHSDKAHTTLFVSFI